MLIKEFTLPDKDKQALSEKLHHISTHKLMALNELNGDMANAVLGKIVADHLPANCKEYLANIHSDQSPPIIVLHNLPIDNPLPPTPVQHGPIDKMEKGYISEYLLRGLAALSPCVPGYFPQIVYSNIVGGHPEIGSKYHVDGADPLRVRIDGKGHLMQASSPYDVSMLFCLRGNPKAKTMFAMPHHVKYAEYPKEADEGAEGVTLRSGDVLLCANQRVVHGKIPYTLDSAAPDDRWLEGGFCSMPRRSAYEGEEWREHIDILAHALCSPRIPQLKTEALEAKRAAAELSAKER